MAYIYNADMFCDDCAHDIKREAARDILGRSGIASNVHSDDFVELLDEVSERNYDSSEYPKWCVDDAEADCPQHCADCGDFFENDLTSDGVEYVKEAVREDIESGNTGSIACKEWLPAYDWIDWEDIGTCDSCGELSTGLDDDSNCEGCAACYNEPSEGDYTITPSGPLGCLSRVAIVGRFMLGDYPSDEDAIVAIKEDMERQGFWPNVWIISDHGNYSLAEI